jgi:hypothetical protein
MIIPYFFFTNSKQQSSQNQIKIQGVFFCKIYLKIIGIFPRWLDKLVQEK